MTPNWLNEAGKIAAKATFIEAPRDDVERLVPFGWRMINPEEDLIFASTLWYQDRMKSCVVEPEQIFHEDLLGDIEEDSPQHIQMPIRRISEEALIVLAKIGKGKVRGDAENELYRRDFYIEEM